MTCWEAINAISWGIFLENVLAGVENPREITIKQIIKELEKRGLITNQPNSLSTAWNVKTVKTHLSSRMREGVKHHGTKHIIFKNTNKTGTLELL